MPMKMAPHNSTTPSKGVCLVIGAGVATGGAIALAFAKEGYTIVGVRRDGAGLKPLVDEI